MGLNDTQVRSVAMAISDRISLIQGVGGTDVPETRLTSASLQPPGTGKTATIVAILQLLKKHFAVPYPILVTSHTHVAVDLLTGKCAAAGLKPLRFGDRLRVGSDLDKHTYHAKIEKHRFQYRLQARSDQQARIEDQLSEIESRLRKPAEGTNIFDAGINGTESDQAETVKLTHEKGRPNASARPASANSSCCRTTGEAAQGREDRNYRDLQGYAVRLDRVK